MVTLLNAKYEVDGLVHRVTYQARLLYDTPAASELPEDQEGWSIESNVTTSGGVRSMSIDKEDTPQDMGLSNVALFIDQIYCLSSMISCPWIGWVRPLPHLPLTATMWFLLPAAASDFSSLFPTSIVISHHPVQTSPF